LDQNAVDVALIIEVDDVLPQRRFIRRGWKGDVGGADAKTCAGFDLRIDVDVRCRVVTHDDDGEVRFGAFGFQFRNTLE